jgi:hypothetical protein
MSRGVMTTDTAGRLSVIDAGEAKASVHTASISAAQSLDATSPQDTDAILAAVLRVFAARGRAIREERAKLEAARLLNAGATEASTDQLGPSAQEKNAKTPGL